MYVYYLPSSVSVQNQISVKFNMHQKLYYLSTGKMSKILLKCFQLLWSTFEFISETMTCTFVSLGKMTSPNKNIKAKVPKMTCALPCSKPGAGGRCRSRKAHKSFQSVCVLSQAGTGQRQQVLPQSIPPKF